LLENYFNKIQTPQELLKLSQEELEEKIKSIGFYQNTHRLTTLLEVSKILTREIRFYPYPNAYRELLSITGVGEKTRQNGGS